MMPVIKKVICLLVLALLFSCAGTDQDETAEQLSGKFRLIWNDKPTTTVTIGWDQGQGLDPVVYYGPKDKGRDWQAYPLKQTPTRKVIGYRGMKTHFAKLKNLTADQIYYFVIKDSEHISDRLWFKTAPDQPKPFTFIAGGDTKSSGAPLTAGRLSHRMVAKLRPLFVIFNGDFCSGDGTDDERWKLWLNDWTYLTTTDDGRLIPIIPVHGNHEDGDYTVLNKLFDAPYQYEDEENIYYSLSFGGSLFHFIALNSQIDDLEQQSDWLEQDLKHHRDYTFLLAGYHKPIRPHTSSKSENDHLYESWVPLFDKYRLDIAFEGDSHVSKITFPVRASTAKGSYQGFIRDDENGTMYIGEGSWGATYRASDDNKPWTLRSGSFNQLKWIHVFPDSAEKPAYMEIRTIITSRRNQSNPQLVVSYIDQVPTLTEENLFEIPANINLFSTEPYGAVIYYPFKDVNE